MFDGKIQIVGKSMEGIGKNIVVLTNEQIIKHFEVMLKEWNKTNEPKFNKVPRWMLGLS